MAEPLSYKISVVFRPGQSGSPADAAQRLIAELNEAFAAGVEQVVVSTSSLNVPPDVFNVDLLVRDKKLVWELNRWVIARARPNVPESFVAMDAPADGASIVRAMGAVGIGLVQRGTWQGVQIARQHLSCPLQRMRLARLRQPADAVPS